MKFPATVNATVGQNALDKLADPMTFSPDDDQAPHAVHSYSS
jgi:hypothetical protein